MMFLTIKEYEFVSELMRREIGLHRQEAKLDHQCKSITDSELEWHLKHADFVESVLGKISASTIIDACSRCSKPSKKGRSWISSKEFLCDECMK